jgi:probable HAF family extracellular repeat protein
MEDTLMTKYRTIDCIILLSALVACSGIRDAAAAIAPAYHITDLGTLGGTLSHGFGINASGQVAGNSYTIENAAIHPFLWTPTTTAGAATMVDLGTLGGDTSVFGVSGWGVNDSGHVAGWSYTNGNAEIHAFLYDGVMHDLGTLGGRDSFGHGINASGQVTGNSSTTGGTPTSAFLWTPTTPNGSGGTMIDLGSLAGPGGGSSGWDVNASGQVVGDSRTISGDDHAFLYDGVMHDLGTLGGRHSYALGINEHGQVAGRSNMTGDAEQHAFLWTPTAPNGVGGTMIDLGTLGGTFGSYAYGVNASGQVVGGSWTAGNAARHAFIYASDSGMVDLTSLIDPLSGWELELGSAINDAGQITGLGSVSGQGRAFLLTPVPEPANLALLTPGLPLIVWRNSRRSGIGGLRGPRRFVLTAVTRALELKRSQQ